jgi:hypothetical protein
MKKVVFTGCPRSGTTALCTLLSHDKDILITNEVGNFVWERDSFSDRIDKMIEKQPIKHALSLKDINPYDFADKVRIDPAIYCDNVNEAYGIEIVGDKLPGYGPLLKDIYHANRDAYFLITIRNVRHFVTSSTNHYNAGRRMDWCFETIDEAQKFWVDTNAKMLENIGSIIPLGAKILLIRYEDIQLDIKQTLKKISDFLYHEIKIENPEGGFKDPIRELRKFNLSDEARWLMDLVGY